MYRIWILINMNDDFDYVLYVCDEVNPLFAEKLKQLQFYLNWMKSYRIQYKLYNISIRFL